MNWICLACGILDQLIDQRTPPDLVLDITQGGINSDVIKSLSYTLGLPTVTSTMGIIRFTFFAPTGAHGITLFVSYKVFFLHLLGSNFLVMNFKQTLRKIQLDFEHTLCFKNTVF